MSPPGDDDAIGDDVVDEFDDDDGLIEENLTRSDCLPSSNVREDSEGIFDRNMDRRARLSQTATRLRTMKMILPRH